MKISFSIYRYNPARKAKPGYGKFPIPYSKGMTVLDVLTFVYRNLDPSLAFRFECRQGICGTCGLMLNGVPVLSCSTQINGLMSVQTIEPLANFPVEKDLIVNLEPVLERYMEIKPYLAKIHKTVVTKKEAERSKQFRKCIECGCCIAGTPGVLLKKEKQLDPMSLVKIARYVTDPRDGLKRRSGTVRIRSGSYDQKLGRSLSELCPRGIPIDEAIRMLQGK